jgi:2-methylcitrate dehydratase PrpD
VSNVEQILAAHVAHLEPRRCPQQAIAAFECLLADFVIVLIAGHFSPEARSIVRTYACAFGNGPSTLVGEVRGVPAPVAAFGHGLLAHWFDWDDTHDESHVHGGAVIFSALLAVSDVCNAAGNPVATATFAGSCIAAYDVACRLGGFLKDLGPRGWMPTGSGATIAAAAACARLLGLGHQGIQSAMGIAAANAGLSRQALADRTNSKGALAGIAAKTAVEAALLAQAGINGAPRFLTGVYGLQILHGAEYGNLSSILSGLGDFFSVTEVGIKPYPCCRSTHAAIAAALEFRRKNPHQADRVRKVRAVVPRGVYERCGARFRLGDDPRLSAQFSIPFTMALALRSGTLSLEDFKADVVVEKSRHHAELIANIEVEPDNGPSSDLLTPVLATFEFGEQKALVRVDHVPGGAEVPPTADDQLRKLEGAAGKHLDRRERTALLELFKMRANAITPLTKLLRDL